MSSANTSTLRRGRMSSHEASSDANEWARKKNEAAEKAKHIKEERMRAQLLREMQSKLDNDAQADTGTGRRICGKARAFSCSQRRSDAASRAACDTFATEEEVAELGVVSLLFR